MRFELIRLHFHINYLHFQFKENIVKTLTILWEINFDRKILKGEFSSV